MTTFASRVTASSNRDRFLHPRTLFLIAWSIMVLVQMLCWPSPESLNVALLLLTGGVLGVLTVGREDILREYPISSIIMLGYTASYFLLPPIATFAEGKPVTHRLVNPEMIFLHAVLCLCAFLGAHWIYRRSRLLAAVRHLFAYRIYRPLGFFNAPGNVQLLVLGAMGLAAMSYQIFVVGSVQLESSGMEASAQNRLMQGLYPLAYLPYCCLIRPLIGDLRTPLTLRWKLIIVVYTAVLIVISIGNNSRSAFLLGIASIGFAYAFGVATRMLSARLIRPRNILIGIVAILVVQGPVADMAASMVIVRGERSNVPAAELVESTLSTMLDRRALEQFRQADTNDGATAASGGWDEYYVDNLFLARLSNLKFADESLSLAMQQDDNARSRMRDIEWQRLFGLLPRPVIAALGVQVDKDFVSTSSGGDLMLFVTTGDYDVLRGFRTGSLFGAGFALFGWFYPLVLAAIVMLIFALADANTIRKRLPVPDRYGRRWAPAFFPLSVVLLFSWCFHLTSAATGVESVSGLTAFILRGIPETILVYTLAYWTSRFIARFFDRRN